MFGKNSKVDLELNRDVEHLIKTGGKEHILPIVQAGEPVLRQQTVAYLSLIHISEPTRP